MQFGGNYSSYSKVVLTLLLISSFIYAHPDLHLGQNMQSESLPTSQEDVIKHLHSVEKRSPHYYSHQYHHGYHHGFRLGFHYAG